MYSPLYLIIQHFTNSVAIDYKLLRLCGLRVYMYSAPPTQAQTEQPILIAFGAVFFIVAVKTGFIPQLL